MVPASVAVTVFQEAALKFPEERSEPMLEWKPLVLAPAKVLTTRMVAC